MKYIQKESSDQIFPTNYLCFQKISPITRKVNKCITEHITFGNNDYIQKQKRLIRVLIHLFLVRSLIYPTRVRNTYLCCIICTYRSILLFSILQSSWMLVNLDESLGHHNTRLKTKENLTAK